MISSHAPMFISGPTMSMSKERTNKDQQEERASRESLSTHNHQKERVVDHVN